MAMLVPVQYAPKWGYCTLRIAAKRPTKTLLLFDASGDAQ
jgi:hypothetical protein